MKSILATMALILSTQAHARYIIADELFTTIRCERAVTVPDLGLSVELKEGGIAGLTQLVVTQSHIGGSSVETFIVQQKPTDPQKLGSSLIYVGHGIRFGVNFTTSPDGKGGHLGHLQTRQTNGEVLTEELSCQGLAHIM